MNIKKSSWSTCFLLLATDMACALNLPNYDQGHWLVSGDVGALWPQINTTMHVNNGSGFPTPGYLDQYSAHSSNAVTTLAAAAGYRWIQQTQPWLPQIELALRYQYLFPQTITGTVTQFSLPPEGYTYSWKTSANVLSAYSKLDLIQYKQVMLYFDVGLGISFVSANNYQEVAQPGIDARVSPGYAGLTSNQFSYNVGAGIDIPLYSQWIFSVGYDYQSFNNLVSGSGQGTWSGTKLKLGSYGMNTFLISLAYLFDNPKAHSDVPWK